jgi:hypothetical protein
MLYFRVTVSAVTFIGEDPTSAAFLAEVFVDDLDIETAAARVVKKLYQERWRIITVHRACSVERGERLHDDGSVDRLLTEAIDTGFAFRINGPAEAARPGYRGVSFADRAAGV